MNEILREYCVEKYQHDANSRIYYDTAGDRELVKVKLYLNFEESQLAELYKQVKLMSTTYTSGVLTSKPTTRRLCIQQLQ